MRHGLKRAVRTREGLGKLPATPFKNRRRLASFPTLLLTTPLRINPFYSNKLLPHYLLSILYFNSGLLIMKSSILLAASTLGSAMAGIHRMPLKKMPLTEQLVSRSVWGCSSFPGSNEALADVYLISLTAISTPK